MRGSPVKAKNFNSLASFHVNMPNQNLFIKIRLELDNNANNTNTFACIDTGSYLNLFPKLFFEKHFPNFQLKHSNRTVSGIQNKITPIVGTFECTVRTSNCHFKKITFNVIDTNIPVLLGMQFLQSESITSFTVHRTEIVFFRKIGQKNFLNRTPFSSSGQQKSYVIINESKIYSDEISELQETLGVKINDKAMENPNLCVSTLFLKNLRKGLKMR